MIEVQLSEIFLWAWCIVATGFAIYYKNRDRMKTMVIMGLLHNDEARERIVKNFKQHMEQQ